MIRETKPLNIPVVNRKAQETAESLRLFLDALGEQMRDIRTRLQSQYFKACETFDPYRYNPLTRAVQLFFPSFNADITGGYLRLNRGAAYIGGDDIRVPLPQPVQEWFVAWRDGKDVYPYPSAGERPIIPAAYVD